MWYSKPNVSSKFRLIFTFGTDLESISITLNILAKIASAVPETSFSNNCNESNVVGKSIALSAIEIIFTMLSSLGLDFKLWISFSSIKSIASLISDAVKSFSSRRIFASFG